MDAAIENYHSLKPTSFHDLIRFELTNNRTLEGEGVSLVVELAPEDVSKRTLLRLTFSGVRELKYNPVFWSFALIDVIPVERGWESIRYRAYEMEQDTEFSLWCHSFNAEIVAD